MPPSESRENLEYRCRNCAHCEGSGLVSVYHEKYNGMPYVELRDKITGNLRRFAMVTSLPCVCPLGFWIRQSRQEEATKVRELNFQDVIEGRIPWTIRDPRLPEYDSSEAPDWAAFRRDLASGAIKRVNPAPAGSRHSAQREMGELESPRSSRRAVVPDDYGKPEPAPAFVPDGSEPPF